MKTIQWSQELQKEVRAMKKNPTNVSVAEKVSLPNAERKGLRLAFNNVSLSNGTVLTTWW
ncbi:hypothetical protein [Paenibacillus flagellatus]|uniref:Uncharacterized protein n=1 Tax=Paenibacillus flagellatus TaxID=2211139 RepID=A0A2V5KHP9_9BACL|nr:hypothetical protein [Paenibacillus flagellatus]PYI53860.1 hypothetical protein DLM86_14995 [Paenibacillus flagellatus]